MHACIRGWFKLLVWRLWQSGQRPCATATIRDRLPSRRETDKTWPPFLNRVQARFKAFPFPKRITVPTVRFLCGHQAPGAVRESSRETETQTQTERHRETQRGRESRETEGRTRREREREEKIIRHPHSLKLYWEEPFLYSCHP